MPKIRCHFSIMGIITAIEEKEKKIIYHVSDCSGASISCIRWSGNSRATSSSSSCIIIMSDPGQLVDSCGALDDAESNLSHRHFVPPSKIVPFMLGDLVKINGKFSVFRNERQLTLHRIIHVDDENEETLWHLLIHKNKIK